MKDVSAKVAISTVVLPERVDSATAPSVETLLTSALRPGARVIVDGSEVIYMSAAGVRTFATVLHRAADIQARIVFCRFSGPAADCLLVSGFSELFNVAETVAEATARLTKGPAAGPDDRLHRRAAAG